MHVADSDVNFDVTRPDRIGMREAIMCQGKSVAQIRAAMKQGLASADAVLLTRLNEETAQELPRAEFDYDPLSRTGIAGRWELPVGPPRVAIVAAGTSDLPVAREAMRTLLFQGIAAREYADVGVAGLWRLLEVKDELARYSAIIAAAGMEGALFSVLGGLVPGLIVALPTSQGYGICRNGETALHAALASCAQGIVSVNIDNGFGAACAVTRLVGGFAERAER